MWARASAGVVAGFFLAAGVVGLVCWALPGPWTSTVVGGLVAFFPVWMGVMGASFAFANGRRAWAWIGALAVLGMGALWGLQHLAWVV